jgi:hypothetical protein
VRRHVTTEEAREGGDALGDLAVAILAAGADLPDQGTDRVLAAGQRRVALPVQLCSQLRGDGQRPAGVLEITDGRMALEGELEECTPISILLPQREGRQEVTQGLGHRQI